VPSGRVRDVLLLNMQIFKIQIVHKPLLSILIGIAGIISADAKDIYIVQSTQGGDTGADAADAHSLAWLNTSDNWGNGVGQVSSGDKVHLVGTFTNVLVVQASGTPNNPITIYFEPGANFTTGCWPSTGAIQLNGEMWIVIDGGVNGLIQNTSNGTGLATQNNSRGIGGSGNGTAGAYFTTIQNLTITNIYTKTKGNFDQTRAGYAIDISGSSITISNCTVSDGDGGLSYSAGLVTQSNIFLLKNTVLNCNHTIVIGMGDHNCYLTNLVIAGNYLDHWDVWDCPGNTPIHLDGIILFNDSYDQSSVMDGTRIYGNTFGGYVGTRTTAAIFTDLGCAVRNYFIYNNLFLCYPAGNWGNGFVVAGVGSNTWVVNNSCIGTVTNGTSYGGGIFVAGVRGFIYNNIIIGGGLGLSGGTINTNVSGSQKGTNDLLIVNTYLNNLWSDHNAFSSPAFTFQLGLDNMNNGNYLWMSGIIGPNLLDWQTWYENEWGTGQLGNSPLVPGLFQYAQLHCDPHSANQMPVFTPGTFIPAANDTVVVGRGTNLFWLGITNDYYGNPRPTNGNWAVGAVEVASANGPVPTISLATSTSNPMNGSYFTLSWDSANATNVTISGLGTVTPTGSTNMPAVKTANFTAIATGMGGVSSAIVSIFVQPLPPSGLQVLQP
jgi:hypothetical protein